uniref:Uncharacterized protein n=1 Tax=Panagrellus redivivus TaxID=6233 RepID=A0A7E4UPE7_PANRE
MAAPIKTPPDEDVWAFQDIGTPFPHNPVRAQAANNTYVALWYKHGKPLMGKAYNDSGVVQCVFAWENAIHTGKTICGKIQVLQFSGNHLQKGFFYEWIKLADYLAKPDDEVRQPVRCGTSVPVYHPALQLLGNLDLEQKAACFAHGDHVLHSSEPTELSQFMILMRNVKDLPPHCNCDGCKELMERQKATPAPKVMINDWSDHREGDEFPTNKPIILALERPLKTPTGPEEQYVALWYRHGNPIIGRALNKKGKISAYFTDGERVFTGATVGSMQLLIQMPPTVAGFDYSWQPFHKAAKYGDKEWHPVHISYRAPCIVTCEGGKYEMLGCANMKEEVVHAIIGDKVATFVGKDVQGFQVLCRKDRDDTMVI